MKAVVFLCLIIFVAFAVLGRWSGDLETLRDGTQKLEADLRSIRAVLADSQTKAQELEQSLVAVQATLKQAVVERDIWQQRAEQLDHALQAVQEENARLLAHEQELEQALNAAQAESRFGSMTLGALLPFPIAWVILAPVAMIGVAAVGFARRWPVMRVLFKGRAPIRALRTAVGGEGVWVLMPRERVEPYIQWVRQTPAAAPASDNSAQ